MNVKRNIVVFVAASLFIFSHPLNVFADRCDDVFEEASQKFESARTVSKQKEYAEAIELYEEAEGYYKKVSEMKNCRCSKIAGTAKDNVSICRKNAAINKRSLENQVNYEAEVEAYEAEVKIVDISNRAIKKFNQGNSYARGQQWESAISAFEEAAEIWESIASTETKNGRKAMQSAKKSREMADLAGQQL